MSKQYIADATKKVLRNETGEIEANFITPEMDGKEMVEGKDFKITYQIRGKVIDRWEEVGERLYRDFHPEYRRIIALPIQEEAGKERGFQIRTGNDEKDFWNEIEYHITNCLWVNKDTCDRILNYLKSKGIIASSPAEAKGESVGLIKALCKYIKEKHTQEECSGFIDGFNAATTPA
jgi:hypothetical protein